MRRIVVGSLGCSLAVLLAGLHAEESGWRPAAILASPTGISRPGTNFSASAASLGAPLPLDAPSASRSGVSLAAPVALDRPVAFDAHDNVHWASPPIRDPQVMRTAFQSAEPMRSGATVRGQNPDEPLLVGKEQVPAKDPSPKPTPTKPEPGPASEATPLHAPKEVKSTDGMTPEEVHGGDLCWDPDHWCWYGGPCGPAHRFYGSVDYLMWWMKGFPVPPLVTTSQAATFSNGFLGFPDTRVLFGDQNLVTDPHSGGRFTAGYWFDPCETWGIEGTFFFLAPRSQSFNVGSAAFPVIARPFFNLNEGREFSEVVATPDVIAGLTAEQGAVSVRASSQLWGAEANLRKAICCDCGYRLDLLAGFRYLDLYDRLDITELEIFNPAAPAADNPAGLGTVLGKDSIATRNQFYGGQIGANAEIKRGRWSLNLRAKVALGATHEVININGAQFVLAQNGTNRIDRGDLLALPTNSGHFVNNELAVVPEAGFDISYQITEHIRAHAGYTFIYWSNVVRPGDQIDRIIDTTNIPNFPIVDRNTGQPIDLPTGQGRPLLPFKQTDFWAQGFNCGLEFIW